MEIEVVMSGHVPEDTFPSIYDQIKSVVSVNKFLCNERTVHPKLPKCVLYIRICCSRDVHGISQFDCIQGDTRIMMYPVFLEGESSMETIDDRDGDSATACVTWTLPYHEFDGLWETLFFAEAVKKKLLSYALTSLRLAMRGVNPNIVCCNRLILLHGPPGTGKTTLCKALAHKISIRMHKSFNSAMLVEVNCHSLFSKWFSESGKLVAKMFSTIREYASNEQTLIVVLIDEVESLTSARQASINSGEPSDAIRVVNAVLTQLDQLRFHSNVFVFATSNLTEAIDPAFADRADIIQFIKAPGVLEISQILQSCLSELKRIKVVKDPVDDELLKRLANECLGLSGRAIRKVPILALSIGVENSNIWDSEPLETHSKVFGDLLYLAAQRLRLRQNEIVLR